MDIPKTEQEWLEVFPEAKSIIPIKISEWKEEREGVIKEFKEGLRNCQDKNEKLLYIYLFTDLYEKKLKKINWHISRLSSCLCDKKAIKGKITPQQIEQAKQIPILDVFSSLYDGVIRRSGRNYFCLCPFHQERNPSFYIYPETNSFYCFGCGKSGDVITLVMELKNLTFKQAVNYLIKGTENG